ncbi:MAG: bifunctional glycosyltransferase family 2/GtrA family protein [Clostridia bacterium]|nr:bifunctional glycosyltransferase family 2/GtrA family protein [Clostridia bacterium]
MTESLEGISVVIPAYKPDEKLLVLIDELAAVGFSDIIVVDDGGGREYAKIFEDVALRPFCTVLTHELNRGKGAALRTAFTYVDEARRDGKGLVSADADGQHLPEDIKASALKMIETGKVILGSRDFSDPSVPGRSRVGNRITSIVFRLFFGMKITDTQTGLRAIPYQYVKDILLAKGERYEYETNALLLLKKRSIPFEELKIQTVYLDENKSSHFRAVRDSLRIYSMILKYIAASLGSSLLDNILFLLINLIFDIKGNLLGTFIAYVAARTIAALVNYLINKNAVFGKEKSRHAILRYLAVAVPLMLISAMFVVWIGKSLDVINPYLKTVIKMIVDTILFFASFRIQHQWVFNSAEKKKNKE